MDGLRAHGGVASLVHDSLLSTEVPLQNDFQTVCVQVHLPSLTLTVCNIYIPPGLTISADELLGLINQLPSPFMIDGDVNAHSPLWGSSRTCPRGSIFESVIDTADFVILNSGEATHFAVATNSSTCIDLVLCSPSLSTDLQWSILDDLYGSDHYPIIVHIDRLARGLARPPQWCVLRADWPTFQANVNLSEGEFVSVEDMAAHFNTAILQAAGTAIPKSTTPLCTVVELGLLKGCRCSEESVGST